MVRFLGCLVIIAVTAIISSRGAVASIYGAETFTLDNGMQVVVIPNHRSPIVSHMVWYRVGSADEPPGKSGIAHFLEHLMFKGTPRFPEGAMTDIVARNGGQQNAFTSTDYTGYYQNIAVDRLPLVMDMEADRMRNLVISENEVAPERDVIIEERRMRIENVPSALLYERVSAALWGTNHYGISVIGHMEEMAQLTREDALEFYEDYYAPHNAILVVAGDITTEELKPLAEKYYGAIPASEDWDGEYTLRHRSEFLAPVAHTEVVMHHERVAQPQWSRRYIAPSYKIGSREDVLALDLFSEIVGGGSTSKLYRRLVVDEKVAVSFGMGNQGAAVSYGTFFVFMTPAPDVSVEEAEAAYEAALADILAGGITEEDVQRAKARFAARLAYAKDSPMTAARVIGSSLSVGLTLDDIDNYPEELEAITLDQVLEAARRLFSERSSATGILLPEVDTAMEGAAQ